jgi:hypothetical protein
MVVRQAMWLPWSKANKMPDGGAASDDRDAKVARRSFYIKETHS